MLENETCDIVLTASRDDSETQEFMGRSEAGLPIGAKQTTTMGPCNSRGPLTATGSLFLNWLELI